MLRPITAMLLAISLPAAAQTSPVPVDLYKNFVGRWVGFNDYSEHGPPSHTATVLVVTEDKHGKSMRFDYTYSSKGAKDYRHAVLIVMFNLSQHEVQIRNRTGWNLYKSPDLHQFAVTGFGKLTALETILHDGHKMAVRVDFEVQPATFNYHWDMAVPGQLWERQSDFVLTRDLVTAAP